MRPEFHAPRLARFTTVDPIRDGWNWYAYVGGDRVNRVDLWGLLAVGPGDGTAEVPAPSAYSVISSWSELAAGEALDFHQAFFQSLLGVGEMLLGLVGVFSGKGTLPGLYLMADGAYMFSEAQVGRKATPLSMVAQLANPVIGDEEAFFVTPLP